MSLIEVRDLERSFDVRRKVEGRRRKTRQVVRAVRDLSFTIEAGELEPQRDRVALARRIGVVFGQRTTLWWDLPLRDSFDLLQEMYRISPERYRSNQARFVELLDLDEPTIGLDVVSKGRLREFFRALNAERGTTLMLTTHDLQDIEALCDRIIVIDHGTAVFDGPLAALHMEGGSTRTLVVDLWMSRSRSPCREPS